MTANYHSHTYRCHHARGTEREYVERAIQAGYRIWGFSDHTPVPGSEGEASRIRMRVDELDGYCNTVLGLRREYRDDIDIRLGLEVEYCAGYFEELLRLTEQYPIEYFLLGQHFTTTESLGPYAGRPTDDVSVLRAYADVVIEAMETGRFLCLAHPDLINYSGAQFEGEAERICLAAKRLGVPLEINLLGIIEGRHYPNERFWRVAARVGNDAVLGADAHDPAHIGCEPAIRAAEEMASRLGIRVLERLGV